MDEGSIDMRDSLLRAMQLVNEYDRALGAPGPFAHISQLPDGRLVVCNLFDECFSLQVRPYAHIPKETR